MAAPTSAKLTNPTTDIAMTAIIAALRGRPTMAFEIVIIMATYEGARRYTYQEDGAFRREFYDNGMNVVSEFSNQWSCP